MYHANSKVPLPADGKLKVWHDSFESARASFPNCMASAFHAYVRAEATRLANKLVLPPERDAAFEGLASRICDLDWVRIAALHSHRFDLVMMLMRADRFRQRVARKLVKQGKIDAATAQSVLA